MPRSFLPRHPREEAKLGTNKYKIYFVVVGSGFSIKCHVTMDTAIDRSNFPAGCTSVTLHARISRVAYTWLGSTPPRLSDTTQSILRLIREVPAGLQP